MLGHDRTVGVVEGYDYEKNVFGPAVRLPVKPKCMVLIFFGIYRHPSDASTSVNPSLI